MTGSVGSASGRLPGPPDRSSLSTAVPRPPTFACPCSEGGGLRVPERPTTGHPTGGTGVAGGGAFHRVGDVAVVWAVWAPLLIVAAALTGWALAVYLRRTSSTERIPPFRWRITPGGTPGWALGLGAGSASTCFLAALKLAGGRMGLFTALTAGWMLLALLVQAALLRRHNQGLNELR